MRGEEKLEEYHTDDAKKLHRTVDGILPKFGGIYQKGRDDSYSLTNEVLAEVCQTHDTMKSFDGYVYSRLSNRIRTEMIRLSREKWKADRMSVPLEMFVGDEKNGTIGDMLMSDFDMERELAGRLWFSYDERMAEYLRKLSGVQGQIVKMKTEDRSVSEIRKKLGLPERQYDRHCREMRSFDSARTLHGEQENRDIGFQKEEKMIEVFSQTSERSKQRSHSISSTTRKMDSYTFRSDHPVQGEAEQWSSKMKGNLISDILQDNPIPALVFAEQIVDEMVITWNLDGKQKCTNVYEYYHDGFRISWNVRRRLICYQAVIKDKAGHMKLADSYPQYERRKCDIRRKEYSGLPVKLQERSHDYTLEMTQYLNCSSKDISYHVARRNEGKPMTQSQKGVAYLGEEFVSMVKSISSMDSFKDKSGRRVSELCSGTINRMVVESIMASNFLEDWKKQQEELCDYIRKSATVEDLEQFEEMMERLSAVVNDDMAEVFNSKDSFLWSGLFARFCKLGLPDEMSVEFMDALWIILHEKAVDGMTPDDLNERSTKDKNVVLGKIRHLERLVMDFLEEKR